MPVSFLTAAQRQSYGRYSGEPSPEELGRYFHLDEADRALIVQKRGDHNRLGFALQLATARFLGTFLPEPGCVPPVAISAVSRQLGIANPDCLSAYRDNRQHGAHAAEIRARFGYREFVEPGVGFRLSRWLYAQCWTGTGRPSILFDRATAWLLAHKVLLPGVSALERFVARLRQRVETRLWRLLGSGITAEQQARLESLLLVPEGGRSSWLDQLRTGPVMVSGPALVRALHRLETVRGLGITLPAAAAIPPIRIATLARFANTAKVTAVTRLPPARRLATLVAFVHTLEASAQDDALEVLEMLLHDLFGDAMKADQQVRLRNLKDLDAVAATLAEACAILLDAALPDGDLRAAMFARIPRDKLARALAEVTALVRPPDDVFYRELETRYRRVRLFLPTLLKHIRFAAAPAGEAVVAALEYLQRGETRSEHGKEAPLAVVSRAWQRHVLRPDGTIDPRAYTFCALDQLRAALRRRDVFVERSWRYADPRRGLLSGGEWDAAKPIICRTLGYAVQPEPVLAALAGELDQTYRAVAARLPDNPAVRFDRVGGKDELILTALDKIEEPPSLVALRDAVTARLPRVDLPEILLEIAARTGFTEAFTHISERTARAADIVTSLCAVLLAEACNTGIEPLVRSDTPSLRREQPGYRASP